MDDSTMAARELRLIPVEWIHKGMNQSPKRQWIWETKIEVVRSAILFRWKWSHLWDWKSAILIKGLSLHILTLCCSRATLWRGQEYCFLLFILPYPFSYRTSQKRARQKAGEVVAAEGIVPTKWHGDRKEPYWGAPGFIACVYISSHFK